MRFFKICLASLLLMSMAYAMPLNSSARACVPADLLQLLSVDYRALKDSPTAMALKQQVLPDNLKQFEAALKNIGIDPEKDVDTLAFASFRSGKQGIKGVGVAAGPFNMKAVLKKMSATPAEKVAVDNTTVDSDGANLQLHFKANDQQFQSLMHSELFAAVSH